MTHESYVSLETARLLKEAGFDWDVEDGYIIDVEGDMPTGEEGMICPHYSQSINFLAPRPTLDVAQRWLREVKGYYVFVTDDSKCIKPNLIWVITRPKYLCGMCHGDTYEDYLEAGIKKCLTILLED